MGSHGRHRCRPDRVHRFRSDRASAGTGNRARHATRCEPGQRRTANGRLTRCQAEAISHVPVLVYFPCAVRAVAGSSLLAATASSSMYVLGYVIYGLFAIFLVIIPNVMAFWFGREVPFPTLASTAADLTGRGRGYPSFGSFTRQLGGFSLLVRPAASTSRDGWRWDGLRRHYDERGPVSPRSRQVARRMDRPGELRQLAFLKIAHSIPCALPPPCSARPALGGRTPWGPDRRAAPKAATHWVSVQRHCSAPCCRGKVPPPKCTFG
jgi:hypothetical protein